MHYRSQGRRGGSVVKNPPVSAGDQFNPQAGKSPWRRKWQPTRSFLWPVEDGLERRKIGGQGTQEFFNSSDQQEAKGEGSRPF